MQSETAFNGAASALNLNEGHEQWQWPDDAFQLGLIEGFFMYGSLSFFEDFLRGSFLKGSCQENEKGI